MNQSNKALRDEVADYLNLRITGSHASDLPEQVIALVTNHIKELPSMQMEDQCDCEDEIGYHSKWCEQNGKFYGLLRNEIRSQILKEMGE